MVKETSREPAAGNVLPPVSTDSGKSSVGHQQRLTQRQLVKVTVMDRSAGIMNCSVGRRETAQRLLKECR